MSLHAAVMTYPIEHDFCVLDVRAVVFQAILLQL